MDNFTFRWSTFLKDLVKDQPRPLGPQKVEVAKVVHANVVAEFYIGQLLGNAEGVNGASSPVVGAVPDLHRTSHFAQVIRQTGLGGKGVVPTTHDEVTQVSS